MLILNEIVQCFTTSGHWEGRCATSEVSGYAVSEPARHSANKACEGDKKNQNQSELGRCNLACLHFAFLRPAFQHSDYEHAWSAKGERGVLQNAITSHTLRASFYWHNMGMFRYCLSAPKVHPRERERDSSTESESEWVCVREQQLACCDDSNRYTPSICRRWRRFSRSSPLYVTWTVLYKHHMSPACNPSCAKWYVESLECSISPSYSR